MDTETAGRPGARPKTLAGTREERKSGPLAALLVKLGLGAEGAGLGSGAGLSKAGLTVLAVGALSVAAGVGLMPGGTGGSRGAPAGRVFEQPPPDYREAGGEEAGGALDLQASGASMSLEYLQRANPEAALDPEPAAGPAGEDEPAAGREAAAQGSPGAAPGEHGYAAGESGARKGKPRMVLAKGLSGAKGGAAPALAPQPGLSGGIGGDFQPLSRAPVSRAGAAAPGRRARTRMGASGRRSALTAGAASRQLVQTHGVVHGNLRSARVSSAGSGATYDGSPTPGGGSLGATSEGLSAGGQGTGAGGLSEKPNPNTARNLRELPAVAPPVGKEKNATSYQHLVYAAMAAIALGGLLLFGASHFKKQADAAPTPAEKAALYAKVKYLAGAATAAAGAAALIGVALMTKEGQQTQGMIFTVIGGILTFQAGMALVNSVAAEQAAAEQATALEGFKSQMAERGMAVESLSPQADGSYEVAMKTSSGAKVTSRIVYKDGAWSTAL